jgi:hypothetical protein
MACAQRTSISTSFGEALRMGPACVLGRYLFTILSNLRAHSVPGTNTRGRSKTEHMQMMCWTHAWLQSSSLFPKPQTHTHTHTHTPCGGVAVDPVVRWRGRLPLRLTAAAVGAHPHCTYTHTHTHTHTREQIDLEEPYECEDKEAYTPCFRGLGGGLGMA